MGCVFRSLMPSNNPENEIYYSIGGGFIVTAEQYGREQSQVKLPYPFKSASELWEHCKQQELSIKDIMLANEQCWRTPQEIREGLLEIAHVMQGCIEKRL